MSTVTYHIAIDRDDDGNFTALTDLISADVLALQWRLGMEHPDDHLAMPARATITLYSPNGQYSPERNTVLPGKRLRIESDDGTTRRIHFTGFITEIRPEAGDLSGRTAVIIAEDMAQWFAEHTITLPIQEDVRADTIIAQILQGMPLRYHVLQGYLIIGLPDYARLDSAKLHGTRFHINLEQGISEFAYVGDAFPDGVPAHVLMDALARSEQGYFFINRAGEATFYNRHHTLLNTSLRASFADDMRGVSYRYGADIVNRLQIQITPRRVGAEHSVLWQSSNTQKLSPGARRQIRCAYRDENDDLMGTLQVDDLEAGVHYRANRAETGNGLDESSRIRVRFVEKGMTASVIAIENMNTYPVYLTHLTLRGTPLYKEDTLLLEHTDETSITFHGVRTQTLDLPMLTDLEDADNLARYLLARKKSPQGNITQLQTDTRQHPTATLALTLFDTVHITERQTGHADTYLIVSEAHQVTKGGRQHRVTWQLRPADTSTFAIIGTSKPDGSAALAY